MVFLKKKPFLVPRHFKISDNPIEITRKNEQEKHREDLIFHVFFVDFVQCHFFFSKASTLRVFCVF